MSVAWFSELYRLNDEGRFAEASARALTFLAERPRDYALHLQRAKALVALGDFEEARAHLDAAVKHSRGLAAWPYFYRAALHARQGHLRAVREDLARARALDPAVDAAVNESPYFAHLRPRAAPAAPTATPTR